MIYVIIHNHNFPDSITLPTHNICVFLYKTLCSFMCHFLHLLATVPTTLYILALLQMTIVHELKMICYYIVCRLIFTKAY